MTNSAAADDEVSMSQSASPLRPARIAGAPISWGVCEVPGWGYQMSSERVLREMREVGLAATEFGPEGFLPDAPADRAATLAAAGLGAVGGFLPVVLHDEDHDVLPEVDAFFEACLASGAGVVVLAAATGTDGYERPPVLDEAQWKTLLANLDLISERAAGRGLLATVHPHMGTLVESAADIERVVEGSRIALCLDTGHLVAAGADPVAITLANPDRVGHVHLKDVDAAQAARVVAGELTFTEAVREGMWTVLGEGSVDLLAMLGALRAAGYDGWYVLEQDLMLDAEPDGEGPVADVRRCLAFLENALA